MSSLDSIPVSRIMSSPVLTIREGDTIQQACKTMVKNDIGGVVVVNDQSNEPSGIITERDVVRHLAEKPISFLAQASQIMSRPIVTIHPNGSIRDALQAMQSRDIRRLVVVSDDGKNMIGIVTDKDIFKFILKNESVASSFVSEQIIGREFSERFSTSLLDDLIHRRA
ncbi:MAG TPA: CBS domain-containing protein [Nitrososphaera sp.]|jgi:CBS domain-containing protein